MLVRPKVRWRCSSQLAPSTGVTTCAYPDTDSSKRKKKRTPTAYDPMLDFLFVVRSIFVLLGLVASRCLFVGYASWSPWCAPSTRFVPQPLSGRLPRLGHAITI